MRTTSYLTFNTPCPFQPATISCSTNFTWTCVSEEISKSSRRCNKSFHCAKRCHVMSYPQIWQRIHGPYNLTIRSQIRKNSWTVPTSNDLTTLGTNCFCIALGRFERREEKSFPESAARTISRLLSRRTVERIPMRKTTGRVEGIRHWRLQLHRNHRRNTKRMGIGKYWVWHVTTTFRLLFGLPNRSEPAMVYCQTPLDRAVHVYKTRHGLLRQGEV